MSEQRLVSRSPQQPADVVAEAATTTPAEVQAAATRARTAQAEWAVAGAAGRSAALRIAGDGLVAHAAQLEDLIVREVGKPRLEARGEVARSVAILHYYAQQTLDPVGDAYPPSGRGLLYTERRPHGVAGLITPWNFPLAIPLWKAAPALAVGNAVLLKPSTQALACARFLEQILADALPENLFRILPGEAETARALLDAADVVSFTGSSGVGRSVAVAAAGRGVPVQAEMGGQNAAIVLPDAHVEQTAAMLAGAAMGFAGQKCTATRRVLVVGDAGSFTDALVTAVQKLAPADPSETGTSVGPLITEAARDAVVSATQEARRTGGRVLAGGTVPPPADGWFLAPTVVDGLAPEHRLACEETFGPFVTVFAAASLDEAVRICNEVRYGLVTSIHGDDLGTVLKAVSTLDTGLIKVNAPTTGVDFYVPFGGEKASSHGPREQGKAGMAFYSSIRTITIAPGAG
ncbi:MAG: aldehyde dehydrogenase family protein [Candidatus Dormibacteraeota bacterium]|uniref:Aldehyde dehydrogenase family protein n=1 Tax=Candidatus Aeolococcus gillhamiae TaxID=3127015 RepID=A0A934N528_9BACT|nr:aldehyde dehydrogenase family protein [Candidatus Dormibacteraeota bacterium]